MTALRPRLVADSALTSPQRAALAALLVAAFPPYAAMFRDTAWASAEPEYRLWLETSAGEIVAHLGFGRRLITVGGRPLTIAGVGGVATSPPHQGQGAGRQLMAALQRVLREEAPAPFGYLNCGPAVVGFYRSVGWHEIHQVSRFIDIYTHQRSDDAGPTLILPAQAPLEQWPSDGLIDLRGMAW